MKKASYRFGHMGPSVNNIAAWVNLAENAGKEKLKHPNLSGQQSVSILLALCPEFCAESSSPVQQHPLVPRIQINAAVRAKLQVPRNGKGGPAAHGQYTPDTPAHGTANPKIRIPYRHEKNAKAPETKDGESRENHTEKKSQQEYRKAEVKQDGDVTFLLVQHISNGHGIFSLSAREGIVRQFFIILP